MLKSVWRLLIAAVMLLGLTVALNPSAVADPSGGPGGGVTPCKNLYICVIVTEPGGTPSPGSTNPGGSGGDDGGVQMCSWNGQQWPCWDDSLGWFNASDGCYYHRSEPQPPADDPAWDGHDPSSGAVYEVNCRGVGGQLTPKPPMFFAQPPGGAPPPDRPVDLGWRAIRKIQLAAPQLRTAPTGTAVVGLPVWLWYDRTPATVGPLSATAPGRTLSVTATATLVNVHWDTGVGAGVDCTTPGTAYRPEAGSSRSPDCGYVYDTSSAQQKDGQFFLTATLTWRVTAVRSDTGAQVLGFDYQVASDTLPLRVGEVQVLN
ncbi:ATP/GTP-binding protein [Kitasatospora atroaurantiaca]|uniref:ATP/GTP-binding protein n=1 Tax=Kitasatospora atroaurantiaca TaxID=285545 RepID=A0A561EYM8_9ACTN|nr:hypothetical protein [Kitasatospora atroaurantiaca]TWE20713.1 hypothetical protein FB465_5871 [Kitasatospora atroaurantiaca]